MELLLEQRYAIEFCVRLGITATETLALLTPQTFSEDVLSRDVSSSSCTISLRHSDDGRAPGEPPLCWQWRQ